MLDTAGYWLDTGWILLDTGWILLDTVWILLDTAWILLDTAAGALAGGLGAALTFLEAPGPSLDPSPVFISLPIVLYLLDSAFLGSGIGYNPYALGLGVSS